MIQFHPSIPQGAVAHACPHCGLRLRPEGWLIPGMRALAELRCAGCGSAFYGDLPAGQGLYTPMLLEPATGLVHDRYATAWFARWLRDSFANRTAAPVGFTVRPTAASPRAKARRAVLLNCLDTLYGHSLLKLLNAQSYLNAHPDFDLLVLVPAPLAWMVPEQVHESWIVDLPLRRGTEWNDALAAEIRRRVEAYDECYLSLAFSHPSACDFSIERFTGTSPFPMAEWQQRLLKPTVTFIWRDDRSWSSNHPSEGAAAHGKLLEFAEILRRRWPELDLAVVGLGKGAQLPGWITDDRCVEINEATERRWCARYASSHVVVGVHGSNMLLPSAHAGATVELVPPGRWGNFLQDLVVPVADGDARAAMFRRRLLPLSTSPEEVAQIVTSILQLDSAMRMLMTRDFLRHGERDDTSRWRFPERNPS